MISLHHWLLAIRPKTLGISLAPVMAGTTLAWEESGGINWPVAMAALAAAVLIQIGTNLYNDAADYEQGIDTPGRLGPKRATAEGWLSTRQVKQGALVSFGGAFLLGTYLAWIGGWPIVLIGLLSITAGYAYTGGPHPIAYSASGELMVFLFFGLAAVTGSYYLQTLSITLEVLWAATAIGLFATAVLLVNNFRDLETDRQAGKLTLSHYLGEGGSRGLYALLLLTPFLLPLMLATPGSWLVLLALPLAIWLLYRFLREPRGPVFNRILSDTARLELLYSGLLCIGLLL